MIQSDWHLHCLSSIEFILDTSIVFESPHLHSSELILVALLRMFLAGTSLLALSSEEEGLGRSVARSSERLSRYRVPKELRIHAKVCGKDIALLPEVGYFILLWSIFASLLMNLTLG